MKYIFTFLIALTAVAFTSQAQNTWAQKTDFGGVPRQEASGFAIGKKVYIGTGWNGSSLSDFWEWDPTADVWTQKADFGGGIRQGAFHFSIGTKGYIGMGYQPPYPNDFWEWDQTTNVWTTKANFPGIPREDGASFAIGTKGYIGCGYYGNTLNDFWEWDQATNTWTQKANFGGAPRLGTIGFAIGNKGYIGVGHNGNTLYKDFWEYDPSSDAWLQKADFGGAARSYPSSFAIGTKGFIGTGWDEGSNVYNDLWSWDQNIDTWTQQANFSGGKRSHAVGFSINGKGYLGTGTDGVWFDDFWEYTPDGVATCNIPTSLSATNITPTTVTLQWDAVPEAIGYRVRYKAAGSSQWTLILSTDNQETITGLTPDTKYGWQVRTVCNQSPVVSSNSAAQDRFTTSPLRSEGGMFGKEGFAELYPNPVLNELTITMATPASDVTIRVYDLQGKMISLPATIQNMQAQINTTALPAGFYTLQITNNKTGMSEVRKFVKQE